MKTIKMFLISAILIALFTNPVFGYPGMMGNTSGANTSNITQNDQRIDTVNTTQSDQNIEISSHLIELDADRYASQNKLYVRETIVFRNAGMKHFSGSLKTWIPDGVENITVGKVQMQAEAAGQDIVTARNGNIISWQDYIVANNVAMYVIEYLISAEQEGTVTKSLHYSKKLSYPTLINYKYIPSPGYPVFILKVSKSRDSSITLQDENRNKIIVEEVIEEDGSVINRFSSIQFKEINIEVSKSAIDTSKVALYLIIGLLIILVLSYPVIRKKSAKLQKIEEKIGSSLKREPLDEEEQEEAKEVEEKPAPESEELSGKTDDEQDSEKRELVTKLKELENDYASGKLMDEEYEELRNSYQEKLKKLNNR